jgi:hypothetical protein
MLAPLAMAAATIAGCPLFPSSWSTNQRVDALPVAPDSAAIVRSIGLDGSLKADFGSGLWEGGPIGIPYQEVRRGRIRHALRITVSQSRRAFAFPARHFASSDADPALPRMGERLRLKASTDVSALPRQARVVARAMKEYGLIVADNGSDWYVTGAPNPGWDNDELRELGRLRGSDFEVVRAPAP